LDRTQKRKSREEKEGRKVYLDVKTEGEREGGEERMREGKREKREGQSEVEMRLGGTCGTS
jgi:hypothetical protein